MILTRDGLAAAGPKSTFSRINPFEVTMLRGAALALRRRADRQSKIDEAGTMRGDRGVLIRTGEAVLAGRLSSVLGALAADFEREIL